MNHKRRAFHRIRRTALISSGLVACIVLGIFSYISYSLYFGPVPTTSGSQTVEGLGNEVAIYRDSWGVPHIYANTIEDLFFAQGYTHAQDRWWQMELTRKLGRGELSQITGVNDDIQQADRLLQTLGFLEAAELDWQTSSPHTQQILLSYTAGVNAYIAAKDTDDLAIEYGLLALSGELGSLFAVLGQNVPVEPWTPVDSILWTKLSAWQMSGNWSQELVNARLFASLSPDLLAVYIAPEPSEKSVLSMADLAMTKTTDTPPSRKELTDVPPELDLAREGLIYNQPLIGAPTPDLMRILGLVGTLRGNSWVVDGRFTDTGAPILANDLQGNTTIPTQWFEMGLHCRQPSSLCPYDVAGYSVPGVPGVIVGHNDSIAWGINTLNADVQDLYLLKLNPNNPVQYLWNGEWRTMEEHIIEVAINEETSWSYPVYSTHLGPVLTDIDTIRDDITLFEQPYQAIALHWSVNSDYQQLIPAILALNQAQNWEEFRSAASQWRWPALNFTYADVDGNIGYQMAGTLPMRVAHHTGLVPVPGWDNTYEWAATIPFDQLPMVYNPADGIIVDANQAVAPFGYEALISALLGNDAGTSVAFSSTWAAPYRAERISYLLDNRTEYTLDYFARMQGDNRNLFADTLLPYIFELETNDEELVDAVAWLAAWDRNNDENSPQAAWFEMFWVELVQATFADQLGQNPLDTSDHMMMVVQTLLDSPMHAWWDDSQTPFTQETRDDMLQGALVRSYNALVVQFGAERDTWQWGNLHHVEFISRLIGVDGMLPFSDVTQLSINRGDNALSGGMASLNTTAYRIVPIGEEETAIGVYLVPSYRLIVDLNDFTNTRAMQATGQSGHPGSPNYDDMIDPWRTVDYHNMGWGQAVIDTAEKQLDLEPPEFFVPDDETENGEAP